MSFFFFFLKKKTPKLFFLAQSLFLARTEAHKLLYLDPILLIFTKYEHRVSGNHFGLWTSGIFS